MYLNDNMTQKRLTEDLMFFFYNGLHLRIISTNNVGVMLNVEYLELNFIAKLKNKIKSDNR